MTTCNTPCQRAPLSSSPESFPYFAQRPLGSRKGQLTRLMDASSCRQARTWSRIRPLRGAADAKSSDQQITPFGVFWVHSDQKESAPTPGLVKPPHGLPP